MKKEFTVLYVDDEPQNLVSFKATFRREYQVFTATSGLEGLDLVRNHQIGLIISDQRMPEMTGVQFLEKIRSEYPDSIRMILTGFSDVEAIIDAINNGRVFRYITKPWNETELRMAIENARQLFSLQQKNKSLLETLQRKVAEQERTLKLFMKYVPEAIVEKTLKNGDTSIFEGELRQATVLFCDIRGFTPMSEKLSPKEVVGFLNDYYSTMTEVIKRHNGTVNQFVGDEIFAAFGAPVISINNERNAVFCAFEMMKKLEALNQKYQEKMGAIEMGIGINSGEVIAGNLGSEDKISYSLTGDTVNTGKRIESLTKDSPNSILISDNVFESVRELIDAHSWEPIEVKGKKEKIRVHQLIRINS